MQEKEALIEIFDENQNFLGSKPRYEIDKSKDIIKNSNILVFDESGKILITLPKGNAFSGKWASSAAGMVRNGESFEQTAKRTLKRELGIEPEIEFLEKGFYDFGDKKRVIAFFKCTINSGKIDPSENDMEGYEWKDLNEVKKIVEGRNCLPTLKKGIESFENQS